MKQKDISPIDSVDLFIKRIEKANKSYRPTDATFEEVLEEVKASPVKKKFKTPTPSTNCPLL